MTKIADPHSLALHEALMIEGGWDQYSDKELASYLSSSSFTPARLRDQLASGELVLLKEIPAVPVFRLVSGSIVPAESSSIAIAENAVNAFGKRFGDRPAFPARGTAYAHSDNLAPPAKLDYTPEPPVIEPPPEPLPPPVVISENFGLPPLGPKVFAKSCTRPSGNTDSNEGQEKASNFGTLAMLAPATVTSPGANGLRPLNLISGSAMRLPKGWALAARIGVTMLGTAASAALLMLWPSKVADATLYTEEELLEMASAAIRVRFHLHVDATGNLRVAGYHVNDSTGYKDRVPVAHAELVGENFEVVVDDDFTLVWYPDDSGHRPVVSTEYPAVSGIDPYSILVTPIQEDGQEHSPPGYQRPFEDQVELIVSFPADSGIEPLYLVFQKAAAGDGEHGSDSVVAVVTAEALVNGASFHDVNQTARVGVDIEQPTLIAERIAEKSAQSGKILPNGNMGTAHAEVGAIQQAFDAGVTSGSAMKLVVKGKAVCGFCRGDVAAMANKADLKSLEVYEEATGNTLYWQPGMKSLKKAK